MAVNESKMEERSNYFLNKIASVVILVANL